MPYSPSKSQLRAVIAPLASVVICAMTVPALADDSSPSPQTPQTNGPQIKQESDTGENTEQRALVQPEPKPSTEQSGTVDSSFTQQGGTGSDTMPQEPQGKPAVQPNLLLEAQDPQMQLMWQQWQKRVSEKIYERYVRDTRLAGYERSKTQLWCNCSYTVSCTGQVSAQVSQPSTDPVYDAICLRAITSLSGNVILQFPIGSHRKWVDKGAGFTTYKFIQ